jgi:hypothetical protein
MKRLLNLFARKPAAPTSGQPAEVTVAQESRMLDDAPANPLSFEAANSSGAWAASMVNLPDSMGGSSQQLPIPPIWQSATQERYEKGAHLLGALSHPVLTATRVGAQLWGARGMPRGKTLHVACAGKLVAVLNTRSHKVALRLDATEDELDNLSTQAMPESAGATPVGFTESFLWDVIWQYGLYDPQALSELPREVAYRPLQLRRLPSVTPELLEPRHTTVLRHLLKDNLTFEQLITATDIPSHMLCQDIAALVLTRAIKPVPAEKTK